MPLSDIIKRMREEHNGRIDWSAGNWVWKATPSQTKRSGFPHPRQDGDGKDMVLIKQRGVICFNEEKCNGNYPRSSAESRRHWFVPLAHCRQCSHYRKRNRGGLPYPHCAHRRAVLGGRAGASAAMKRMVADAVAQAKEWGGG